MHGGKCTCSNHADIAGSQWLNMNISGVHLTNTIAPRNIIHSKLIREHESRFSNEVVFPSDTNIKDIHVIVAYISFSNPSTLTALYINSSIWPKKIYCFDSNQNVDYDNYKQKNAIQIMDVIEDKCANLPHTLLAAKFNNKINITIVFESESEFDLKYLNFKGNYQIVSGKAFAGTYEKAPNLSDHAIKQEQFSSIIQ